MIAYSTIYLDSTYVIGDLPLLWEMIRMIAKIHCEDAKGRTSLLFVPFQNGSHANILLLPAWRLENLLANARDSSYPHNSGEFIKHAVGQLHLKELSRKCFAACSMLCALRIDAKLMFIPLQLYDERKLVARYILSDNYLLAELVIV
jgi:hypothetical protein